MFSVYIHVIIIPSPSNIVFKVEHNCDKYFVHYSMETACHSPMHYWDMTMDSDMIVPTDSIMFSEEFYGNGDGIVRTGPFAHWRTPIGTPIIRNIGSGNLL